MADVSTRLRRARERARLEIADISARTKIKPAFIAAIDSGELDRLPGNFFTRAFLKAYAAEVGLDPAAIARQYDEACGRTDPITLEELAVVLNQKSPPLPPLGGRVRHRWAKRGQGRHTSGVRIRIPQFDSRAWRPAMAVMLVAVALMIAAFLPTPDSQAVERGAVGTSGVAEAAPPVGGAPMTAPETLTIVIAPAADVWVTAKADGEPALFRVIKPGERVTLDAQRELAFRIGNAAAFQYSINGVPGKTLGGDGEVREFLITPQNYRTYAR